MVGSPGTAGQSGASPRFSWCVFHVKSHGGHGMPCGWQTGCETSCQTGLKLITAKGQGEEEKGALRDGLNQRRSSGL